MPFKITIPASTSPVSVAELNTHLQLFGDDSYDTELANLILTAQEFVSAHLGEFVSDTVVQLPFKDFDKICLTHKRTSNISVQYYDTDNNIQVLGSENYILDSSTDPMEISFKTTPTNVSNDFTNAGFVQYSTGYINTPKKVKHAILVVAAELFNVRTESTDAKQRVAQLTAASLLRSEKRW